jgi:biotin operon repressor
MTKTHEAILKMLSGFQRTFGKNYCRPPQRLMLKRLKEYHGIDISLRTLNRRLKELREWGYLWKIIRHIRGGGIKMVCRATAYYLLDKTRKYFLGLKRAAERLVVCFRVAKFGNRLVFKTEQDFNVALSGVEILLKSPQEIRLKPSQSIL